jgi:hypothetical protein
VDSFDRSTRVFVIPKKNSTLIEWLMEVERDNDRICEEEHDELSGTVPFVEEQFRIRVCRRQKDARMGNSSEERRR